MAVYRAAISRTYAKMEAALERKDVVASTNYVKALSILVGLLDEALDESDER